MSGVKSPLLDTGRLFRVRRSLLDAARITYDVSPLAFVALAVVSMIEALLPSGFTLSLGHLVRAVPAATNAGSFQSPAGRALVRALLLSASLFLANNVVNLMAGVYMTSYRTRVNAAKRRRSLQASSLVPGIKHLEDPEYLDLLKLASGGFPDSGMFAAGLFSVFSQRIMSLVSTVIVGVLFSWPVAMGLLLTWTVVGFYLRQGQALGFAEGKADLRRNLYIRSLAYDVKAAKEIRIFALGPWILNHFTRSWLSVMEFVWKHRSTRMRQRILLLITVVVTNCAAYGYLAYSVDGRHVTLPHLPVIALSMTSIASIAMMNEGTISLSLGIVTFSALTQLETMSRSPAFRMKGLADPAPHPRSEIVFEEVRFSYPGTNTPIFDGLNLTIKAGHSLGIVGANGAGKTTFIKLLARLCDPDGGRICVDGIDIREFDPAKWQRRVAAIFQDFTQYKSSIADNIGFGSIERFQNQEWLDSVATQVGIDGMVRHLDAGWQTVLSRQFEGGTELSGGQWQRVALARALFAVKGGAGVLVLDEPTANLDVRAEADIFDRFLELTTGTTAVLISHRFSTVRRADRIVVFDAGRVVEDGSHDELLSLDGIYARSFRLQAERYESLGPSDARSDHSDAQVEADPNE